VNGGAAVLKIIEERNSVAGRKNAKRPAPEINFGMLNSLIGFNLRMAQGIMYRHYAESVAKLGMGQRRFAVLELIACNPGVSQVDIAAALNVDRPAMMLVVDHLENRKLILRRRSEKDRRRQELHLTPNGVEFLRRIRAIVRDHEKTFASLFSKKEAAALNEQLQRIAGLKKKGRQVQRTITTTASKEAGAG
jgi:DNA-binding MarR family transcriptional regulator